jgi:DivIVA domain-containing protein
MATLFLVLVVVLVLAALVFGVITLLSGDDPGLVSVEPDGRARPLPNNRSLSELDLKEVKFDIGLRGYRMSQVDKVLRRTAYDLGYKDEMIAVLEAEVIALRDGRMEDAELLRKARESAAHPGPLMVSPSATKPADASDEDADEDESQDDQDSAEDGGEVTAQDATDDPAKPAHA